MHKGVCDVEFEKSCYQKGRCRIKAMKKDDPEEIWDEGATFITPGNQGW